MSKRWLAGGVFGALLLLGGTVVVLDRTRASVRIVPGLADALRPDGEPMTAPATADTGPTRSVIAPEAPRPADLVVHVVDENEESIALADVLLYHEEELVREGRTERIGVARLFPFSGSCSLRVERFGTEIARRELAEGRGRVEVVVPPAASVAGVVRVDGVPRRGIYLELHSGPEETWMDALVNRQLENLGWRRRTTNFGDSTDSDGVFRFDWLSPQWSGVLHLEDSEYYRFANSAKSLALARPTKGLVLELKELSPQPTISGRVVFDGRPVPHARWRASLHGKTGRTLGTDECDGSGRFLLYAYDEMELARLEFFEPAVGLRTLELHGGEALGDIGDVELEPVRSLPLVVRTGSGEPIAGARALLPNTAALDREDRVILAFSPGANLFFASDPTDAEGRAEMRFLLSDQREIRVGAPGFLSLDVSVPAVLSEPLAVVLQRGSSLDVTVRDPQGTVPPGLRVKLTASESPFTWKDSHYPDADELALGACRFTTQRYSDNAFNGEFPLVADGRLRIDSLRPGARFDLSVVDECGMGVAESRDLVLEPGQWRSLELLVTEKPRRLIVTLRDSLGNPIPGARMSVHPPHDSRVAGSMSLTSDRAGMLQARVHAEEVMLRLTCHGFESRTIERVPLPGEGAMVEVVLARDWWPW